MKASDDAMAALAAKDLPDTARQSFKQILASSTEADPRFLNKNAQRTDFSKVLNKLDKMPPKESAKYTQQEYDLRAFLQREARHQKLAEYLKSASKIGFGIGEGGLGLGAAYGIYRALSPSNDSNR
jgi:hypothetical protein